MTEKPYRIATSEENTKLGICDEYDTLLGPDGFECILTEPEDRYWFRDASSVIIKLNEQHEEIQRLQEELESR
jgi:hypothetical protein